MGTVGVVTGAGRGMGFECARLLAGVVDTLVLVDLDAQTVTTAAQQLASDAGAVVEPFVLDITDTAGLEGLLTRVAELGTLRAVAHVAGISPTMADWRRIFTVDLVATARLAEVLRPLATAGTAWVCFASMAPAIGGVEIDAATAEILDDPLDSRFLDRIHEKFGPAIEQPGAAYAVAKLAVKRFVQQEAVRLGPLGGRINSVSPGLIDTPQGRQEAADNPRIAEWIGQTPVGRLGRADELAAVVAFALSDEASFLNGTDLLVDGGLCAAVRGPGSK